MENDQKLLEILISQVDEKFGEILSEGEADPELSPISTTKEEKLD